MASLRDGYHTLRGSPTNSLFAWLVKRVGDGSVAVGALRDFTEFWDDNEKVFMVHSGARNWSVSTEQQGHRRLHGPVFVSSASRVATEEFALRFACVAEA